MIQVLTQDVIRQHIDRIEPACIADLFALAETRLPGPLAADLSHWAARASREILDIPDGPTRGTFLAEVAEIPPESVPNGMRRAILALASGSIPDTAALIERLRVSWADIEPAPVKLGVATAAKVAEKAEKAAKAPKVAGATKPRVVKTPASMVDPRRAEWIRGDAVTRLGSREYSERGLKESIFVAGIKHRSPYKDLTDEEVKAELRKLERERKLKHTGERWLIR
ncbi:MAG: hypothetical protein Q8P41_02765 [Pseudomonadota bacterium]|nr:hypothetical protein [Pseudomonadota bacterium]